MQAISVGSGDRASSALLASNHQGAPANLSARNLKNSGKVFSAITTGEVPVASKKH